MTTLEDRCEMARLHTTGTRSASRQLWIARSTVARELNRNGSTTQGYQPGYAFLSGLQARPRQHATVLAQLIGSSTDRSSPTRPSSFIYAQMARKTEYAWRHYLPAGQSQTRAPLLQGAHLYRSAPPARIAVPRAIGTDLMLFRIYGQAILTLHERHSRLLIAARPPGKAAAPIAHAIATLLAPLPPTWRQTITFDNGTEFARHYALHTLGLETFFCETHSPWQKGGIENAIGRLRRTLPRKTDLAIGGALYAPQVYNNTPRKCLG